jgi:hypothetical protein
MCVDCDLLYDEKTYEELSSSGMMIVHHGVMKYQ